MRILVACEWSGEVRDAFRTIGHDAVSCDLLPSEAPGPHIQADVRDVLEAEDKAKGWDMLIAFPPCTHLASSGARWFDTKQKEQRKAIYFFLLLARWPVRYNAIENPIGIMSTFYRKPDQIIQPWQFGHGETKATCLWLKNLPLLKPTNVVEGREPRVHYMSPSPERSKLRGRTYHGIALAMAEQWGSLATST